MFFIRVDANGIIGMGHLTRCLSIATALRDNGENVCFVMADDSSKNIVETQGFACKVLNTDYSNMEEELRVFVPLLQGAEAGLVLVDSYFVTNVYFEALRQYCKVAYMDDFGKLKYNLDGIINGNIYGTDIPYKEQGINKHMECITGCAYTPLRREFLNACRSEDADRILVTTGGSDPMHITIEIVKEVLKRERLSECSYDIVCGRFNQDTEEIRRMCVDCPNIKIHQNVKDMWTLMERSKCAITAGGSTMYELAKMGIPMCSFSFVDNQERIVQGFYNKGYSCCGCNYLEDGQGTIEELCDSLERLLSDPKEWDLRSERLMKLVDGYGSIRIAERLSAMLG